MDGDRLAVPLTRMEGFKSKLSKGVQGVSQTAKGAVEGVSKGVQLREQTAGAAMTETKRHRNSAEVRKGFAKTAAWDERECCEHHKESHEAGQGGQHGAKSSSEFKLEENDKGATKE